MLRKITGVFVGYLVFAVSAVLYFQLSGIDPHASGSVGVRTFTSAYGVFFSMLGGYVLQVIAKAKNLQPNFVLTIVMECIAVFSMYKSTGSPWTQVQTMILFAPLSILGGYIYLERNRK